MEVNTPIADSRTNLFNATAWVDGLGSCWARYAKMEYPLDRTTPDIIEQLEARLRRIEYITSGHLDGSVLKNDNRPVSMRLKDLEQGLGQLVSKSRVVQDLLRLRKLFLFLCAVSSYQHLMPSRCSPSRFLPHFRAMGSALFS
jgi:hypothetical protein